MKPFKFKDDKSLYHNWFKLYSQLLFPDSKKRRERAFKFHYYRFALATKNVDAFDFEKVGYKRIANELDELIGKTAFLEKNLQRTQSVYTAGVLGRLYNTMHVHGFKEPSQNKVLHLYNYRFSDLVEEGKSKKDYGVAYARRCLERHRSQLPYCVAWTLCKPIDGKSCKDFKERLIQFFSLADGYKEKCKEIKRARKAQASSSFIEPKKLLEVEWWHEVNAAKPKALKPYRLNTVAQYAARANIRNDELYSIL